MRIRFILFFSLIVFAGSLSKAQKIGVDLSKETYIFAIKGNDTLRLDKYEGLNRGNNPSAAMIYVFGGGFFTGERYSESFLPYFKFYTDKGYTVFSIDYRLGFKNVNIEGKPGIKDFIALFENTIYMAVEDLLDATRFILEHANEWNIDRERIVTSGSSAGGITVLQAGYEISTGSERARRVPDNFNYAGIISFAGAIYSNQGNLKWSSNTAPIQLFHGDADKNVPYNRIKFCKLGFFGSKNVAKRLGKYDLPYYFYTEINTDHRVAGTPMSDNLEDIQIFLDKYVARKKPLQTVVTVDALDKPKVKKNFSIFDYIRANFQPDQN